MKGRIVTSIVAFSAIEQTTGFQVSSMFGHRVHCIESELSVAARDIDTESTESVPYVMARGDGSSGGGGVAMPRGSEDDETSLVRPKVGAEMPLGRPSWFHVPAPSSGESNNGWNLAALASLILTFIHPSLGSRWITIRPSQKLAE